MMELTAKLFDALDEMVGWRDEMRAMPRQRSELEKSERDLLGRAAFGWRQFLWKHEFHELLEQAFQLEQSGRQLTYAGVAERLTLLESMFRRKLRQRAVYVIREADFGYARPVGFGGAVERSFPSSKPEILAARQCYALGQYTASVFHLMRAVEYLLRAFVVAMGVKPKKPVPLEYQVWEGLIRQAEAKIDARLGQKWRSRVEKAAAAALLRESIADFNAFKECVRNPVMHTRSGLLDQPGALTVMNRVQVCFERLAPHIEEGQRRSILRKARWS